VQMGFIVAMLVPLYAPPATTFAATLFALPFLVGFLYDWLLVSRQIDPRKRVVFPSTRMFKFIPTCLRFSLAGLLGYFLVQQDITLPWLLVFIPLALFLVLGLAGRLSAILLLIFLGLLIADQPLTGLYPILFALSITLFFSGTGAFSLWTPEDSLIYKRAGEKNA
jgi:hypothetical protein